MKKNKKNNYQTYLYIVILLIILLIIYGIFQILNTNKTILLDNNKDIVYNKIENKDLNQYVPNINIKEISTTINNDIDTFTNPYLNNKAVEITNNYEINGNILSLIIIITDFSNEIPDYTFKSYIIDLSKLKILTEDEYLSMFNTNKDYIHNYINNIFSKYYKEELTNKIIDSSTTYNNYLKLRELTNLDKSITYYIEKGNLVVYLDYNIYSEKETSFYLEDVSYKFYVN